MHTPHGLKLVGGREPTSPRSYEHLGVQRVHIAPGRLIPGTRYKALRWLGEGGMGVVYEAEHVDIGRRVAVKLLRHHYCGDEEALSQFRQEARASAQIGSDNITEVYDFAQLPDGRLMIAMELLEGRDLLTLIGGGTEPIDPGRAIGILRQCCRALAAAHDAGVVHRDLKPENVFLVDEGRPDKVKVLDFGIAVVLSGDKTHKDLIGTPQYIAPEMITRGEVGPRGDQYALGCVAYEMLTGQVAFDAPSVAQVIDAHLFETPSDPSSVKPTVPKALDAVVMRSLAREPGERFADMRDFEAALCEAQIEAGLTTPWDDLPLPQVAPERRDWLLTHMREPEAGVVTPRRKHWLWFSLAGAVVLGAAVSATVFSLREPPSSPANSVIEQRVASARAAAARAYWVYPPLGDPEASTAYREVVKLEDMAGPLADRAKARAQELRDDFAHTLNRLGDQYWDAQGGKPFALEYYKQALVFDDDIEPAAARAAIDPRELELLESRARLAQFTDNELIAAEPLNVLAEPDAEERARRYGTYLQRRDRQLSALDESLSLAAKIDATHLTPKRADLQALQGRRRGAEGELDESAGSDEEALVEEGGTPGLEGEQQDAPTRRTVDRSGAKRLAEKGRAALSAGKLDEAELLFEQALGKYGREPVALAGLRDLYFDRGDYGRAARYGKRLVGVTPKKADAHLRLGDAYFKVARYQEAETHYAKALALKDTRAQWRLDKTRSRLGK